LGTVQEGYFNIVAADDGEHGTARKTERHVSYRGASEEKDPKARFTQRTQRRRETQIGESLFLVDTVLGETDNFTIG
jgi:hypothetical protein